MLNHIHGEPEQDEMFACFLLWKAWKDLSHVYPHPQAPQSGSTTVEHSLQMSGSPLPSQELCWFGRVLKQMELEQPLESWRLKKAKTLALWE